MEAVKCILRYLKGTIRNGLTYIRSDPLTSGHYLSTYTDVNWVVDPHERRLVSGYCIYIGHNLVSWNSQKQKSIAKYNTKVEY